MGPWLQNFKNGKPVKEKWIYIKHSSPELHTRKSGFNDSFVKSTFLKIPQALFGT